MRISGREFELIGDHARSTYLRYSFTRGTAQEVDFLFSELALRSGMRLLDVGCGPGRHAWALRDKGVDVVGVDVSAGFLSAAGPGLWARADARDLPVASGSFDAAISLCQGGFGLLGGEDARVLEEMGRAVRQGGRVAVSAPSAYFVVGNLEPGDDFDAATGVNHECVRVRDASGDEGEFDLWSTCFTPRELELMCRSAGLRSTAVWSVRPGEYRRSPPDLDHPELLAVAAV